VETLPDQPPRDEGETFTFAPAESYPETELGDAFRLETPLRFQKPATGVTGPVAAWCLRAPAFGGFQAALAPPTEAKAYDGVRLTLIAEKLDEPTPVRIVVKEPVHSRRDWLVADAILTPSGEGRQSFTLELRGNPVINLPPVLRAKPRRNRRSPLEYEESPGVPFGVMVTTAGPVNWLMGRDGTSATFLTTDMDQALAVAASDQIEYARQGFSPPESIKEPKPANPHGVTEQ
jgi:hypothetical protein